MFSCKKILRIIIPCFLENFPPRFCYFSSNSPYGDKVSLYLQRAKLIDSLRLGLRSSSVDSLIPLMQSPALDCFVVNNALKSAPSPESALSLVEILKEIPHFSHNQNTLFTLAKILAKSGQTTKLRSLINAINAGKFTNVARVSFMDRMRWFALAGDLNEVVSSWEEWRASQRRPSTESYNIVMGLFAQMGMDSEAISTFRRMIDEGVLPNSRTYTVIIEHLVKSGHLDSAFEVFRILPQMRIKRTSKQYSVLVAGFSEAEKLDNVKTLLNEMQTDGILPGRAIQSCLQLLQDAGYLDETSELIKEMLPDERIKKITYSVDDSDNDMDREDGEDNNYIERGGADEIQLKPWFDPVALASALQHWGSKEVSTLEETNFVWTTRLVCKMIRSFSSAETAWKFFNWVAYQPGFTHDIYTISRMVTKLARHGCVQLVDQLLFKIQSEGIRLSFSTVRLIIDFYGGSGNGDAALNILRRVRTVCGPLSKSSQLILYTSVLRTLTKCKMNDDAINILEEMILLEIFPEIQTFSGLMSHFALEGDIKTVQRLFGMVRQGGLEADAYTYIVLIRAYCKCGRASLAMRLFEDMANSNLVPDATTIELLVNSLWKEGKLREAALIEEKSEEINDPLPVALPGNLYTLSSVDLLKVYNIYANTYK